MFLQHQPSGSLVEVLSMDDLVNPSRGSIAARFHAGEEIQDREMFVKSHLAFPSGEPLPQCWMDSHYREHPRH